MTPGPPLSAVVSPLPGLVRRIWVRPGDPVQPGQAIALLDTPLGLFTLRAHQAGRVWQVTVQAGALVNGDDPVALIWHRVPD